MFYFFKSWGLATDSFQSFCGLCYNIQFKPYATSKMELFAKETGNGWKMSLTAVTRLQDCETNKFR